MKASYDKQPIEVVKGKKKEIAVFSTDGENIDPVVVQGFGDEWLKFKDFDPKEIDLIGSMYFDIVDETIVNKNTYVLDLGCGTGRWTKYLSKRAGFIEAIDPSNAVIAADYLLGDTENIRITKASSETIPFPDETFDFAMSVGVLHHIPDTQKAMTDCVKKVKKDGYFYVYLYYNLENKGPVFMALFHMSNFIRKGVCRMPAGLKKISCDVLAVTTYMPFVLSGRLIKALGFKKLAAKIPLSDYQDKSFFIIRNDALDKYGTTLEQRFSKEEVITMMRKSGLDDIRVSPQSPFYHAIGRKV